MSEQLLDVYGDASVVFDVSNGYAFDLASANVGLRGGRFGPTSTERADGLANIGDVAVWGANNTWPQEVIAEINESDLLRPLIRKQAKRMIGQGLVYGTTFIDDVTGEEKMRVMRTLEIDRALKKTNVTLFLYEAWIDWITHGNVFVEFQMSHDGKIVGRGIL